MASPNIVGGNGYRWRGRAIRTILRNGIQCVTMPRKDSMVMVPVGVKSEKYYKVTIAGSKSSGNGALLVNFFGGRNYDGKQIPVNIKSGNIKEYTIIVPVPKYPTNLPVYLRVWRPNNASGNVFINTIRYSVTKKHTNTPHKYTTPEIKSVDEDKLRKQRERYKPKINPPGPRPKTKIKSKNKNTRKLKKYNPVRKSKSYVIKEDKTMKFKPYLGRSADRVNNVLIKKASDVPMVSVITPTRDGEENIKKCYKALNENTGYPNWEWIVGDSNSEDGTVDFIKSLKDPRVKLIERRTTEGSFSSINNELVKYASGDYLLFLNDDTEPQRFWLFEMMSKIYRHNDIGIVGAKLMYDKDRVQHAGIAFIPQGPANLGKAVLKSFPKQFADHDRFFQAVTGACLLIRKNDFESVKGFDPAYYFCYEDVDLCLKIKYNLGKKILYASKAKVHHRESVTQRKHKTSGELQQNGIKIFKERWMSKVSKDFGGYQRNSAKGIYAPEVSFVTCVNNMSQYRNYVIGSLFKNNTKRNYEVIPIFNFGNPYSAAQALNIGINKAKSDIVVLCHQDVLFYENWIDMLFERIHEIETTKCGKKKWGVLGTAGINKRDDTVGVVHNIKGSLQWQATKRAKVYPVQTVDEHCMVIRKSSGLRFDEKTFTGFHLYGPGICMSALDKGFKNYGILCPLVHDSNSGSLVSGKKEFMRNLNAFARKWRTKFSVIRTPTSIIRRNSVRTFVRFKNK